MQYLVWKIILNPRIALHLVKKLKDLFVRRFVVFALAFPTKSKHDVLVVSESQSQTQQGASYHIITKLVVIKFRGYALF